MADRYGEVAAWAREAGYDGVQLGSANAKLLDQFLSPFYNRRTDEFGGLARTARPRPRADSRGSRRAGRRGLRVHGEGALRDVAAGLPAHRPEPTPSGCAALVQEWGFDAVTPVEVSVFPDTTLSRGATPDSFWTNPGIAERLRRAAPTRRRRAVIKAGAWWGGRRAPFRPVWNRELFAAAKQAVEIPVLAVGGIRTGDEVRQILDDGEADLVGIGRPFYAEPDLARRILDGRRRRAGGAGARIGACPRRCSACAASATTPR